MTKCNWPLSNGSTLAFSVYDRNEGWNRVAGLYLFAWRDSDGRWYALYVGQTEDFSSRLPSHERLNEAVQRGATHIHALVVPNQDDRDSWEAMLIKQLQPPMNTLLR